MGKGGRVVRIFSGTSHLKKVDLGSYVQMYIDACTPGIHYIHVIKYNFVQISL